MTFFGLYLLTNWTVFFGNIPEACVLNPHACFQNGGYEGSVSMNGLIMFLGNRCTFFSCLCKTKR
jgi:hypothetical protein